MLLFPFTQAVYNVLMADSNLNFSKASASVDWCWCGNALVCAAQGLAAVF